MAQSYGKLLIFLYLYVGTIECSCTFRSAKWSKVSLFYPPAYSEQKGSYFQGAPKVGLTSSTITNKVLVDWSGLIVNKE